MKSDEKITQSDIDAFVPAALWTNDCQGKKDFDGGLLDISTRYWPSNYQSNGLISAHASIIVRFGPLEDRDDYGDYKELIGEHFEGPTEANVKAQVEAWVSAQCRVILGKLIA